MEVLIIAFDLEDVEAALLNFVFEGISQSAVMLFVVLAEFFDVLEVLLVDSGDHDPEQEGLI